MGGHKDHSVNPTLVRLLRRFADDKLKQRNKMSKDPLNRRPVRLPRLSSVHSISEPDTPMKLARYARRAGKRSSFMRGGALTVHDSLVANPCDPS
jgi:hypothetical protein